MCLCLKWECGGVGGCCLLDAFVDAGVKHAGGNVGHDTELSRCISLAGMLGVGGGGVRTCFGLVLILLGSFVSSTFHLPHHLCPRLCHACSAWPLRGIIACFA